MTRPRVTVARLMAIVLFRRAWFRRPENTTHKKNAEIAVLSVRIKTDGGTTRLATQDTLTTIIRELRDRLERPGNTLELPDGYVTVVDYERQEVEIDITRRQGARPQMKMSDLRLGLPRHSQREAERHD